jgi:cytochrome c oxidase subunit 2
MSSFPLFPPSASTVSTEMDLLYLFIVSVCTFFAVLVTVLIVVFTLKFKRREPDAVGANIHGSIILELTWTLIPLVLAMAMFAWGADLFFRLSRPPRDAMEITVVGKQWMWKIQHPDGTREINELHVPVGRPVRITLGSEDVIHNFSLPAFRVKMDAVPGKLTTLWFEATKVGTYHLFCAEYCGTNHSGMVGQVTVMTPEDYEAWLGGGRTSGTPVENGERLFADLACITCHKADSTGRGPSLVGVFGSTVELADGRTVIADENYLRESIMNSQAKVVRGYQGIMPPWQGMVSEENLLQLIAYIKSLRPAEAGGQ